MKGGESNRKGLGRVKKNGGKMDCSCALPLCIPFLSSPLLPYSFSLLFCLLSSYLSFLSLFSFSYPYIPPIYSFVFVSSCFPYSSFLFYLLSFSSIFATPLFLCLLS